MRRGFVQLWAAGGVGGMPCREAEGGGGGNAVGAVVRENGWATRGMQPYAALNIA